MTCHDARELFSAMLDEALTPAERAPLDAHLAACAECVRELDRFRRAVALVQALPPEHAPPGFVDRVTAAARPEPWTARLRRELLVPWKMKLPLEAAALLLVGGLAVLVFRGTEEQQRAAQLADQRPYLERPATASETATRTAEPQRETGFARQETPTPSPPTSPPTPVEPQAPTAPPARVQPPPLARPPATPPQEPPAARAAPRQEPAAREGTDSFRDVVAGRASAPRPEARAKREGGPATESDARPKAGPPQAAAGSGAVAGKEAVGKLSAGGARERKDQQGVAPDAGPGRLGAAQSRIAPDVRATLIVADAQAAAARVEAIAGRLNGVVAGRQDDADSLLLLVVVRRDQYLALVHELTGLGQWRMETEVSTPSLPPQVRVAIRVAGQRSR
jgi:Putative zinc-finger